MPWAVFSSRFNFDQWHHQKCVDAGIPYPGYDQDTREPGILKQWTDASVDPFIAVGVTRVFAEVSAEDVAAYGLTAQNIVLTGTSPELTLTAVVGGQTRVLTAVTDDDHREPKPVRVTIDGHEYDTTTGERTR